MNQVVLMGRLTRDPELRHTQSNIPVASFSLAVDRGYSKNREDRQTDFIDCVAWRGTAEFVSKYFIKGQMAAVTGSKKETGSGGYAPFSDSDAPPAPSEFSSPMQESSGFSELGDDDDELPF